HATEMVMAMHLAKVASSTHPGKTDHFLYLLGKTGEPIVGRPVTFLFQHRNTKRNVEVTLEPNAEGACHLGHLEGIVRFDASSTGQRKDFTLSIAASSPRAFHSVQGETIELPVDPDTQLHDLCLVELRGGAPWRDVTGACRVVDRRCIEIRGLTPGEYRLS